MRSQDLAAYQEGLKEAVHDDGDEDIIDQAERIIALGWVTKVSGVLMSVLTEIPDVHELRLKVQAEVQFLRTKKQREANCLHPVLYTRVRQALLTQSVAVKT